MAQTFRQSQVEGKRVAIACQRCRNSKLKCSGTHPCQRCQRRSVQCLFDHSDLNSVNSASAVETNSNQSKKRSHEDDIQSLAKRRQVNISSPAEPLLSKVASGSSIFLRNRPHKRRKWLYLGASSTWSFNIRIASIVQVYLGQDSLDRSFQFALDGDAYAIELGRINKEQQPDLSRLPSFDYALYLINTVKYHLGGIFHIFDEDHFMQNLRELYEEGPAKIEVDRLWYTQYLTLLAFGKSLLYSSKSAGLPQGTEFFCRAMAVLPDMGALHEEPILAAEVLCLIALYFHCLDMRQTAYSYIGQALRVCLVDGLHTNLPATQIGEAFATRCNNVWWTTYILDRTLSATVGAPTSVSDEHISTTLPVPTESPKKLATLSLHVKLSRLISVILADLYSAKGSLESSYLAKTQSVLRKIVEIAQEMEQVIDIKFKSTFDMVTRAATHLRLLYHQCIILAIRPLLLCLLQDTLRQFEKSAQSRLDVPSTVRDLIQTCINSATKTLKIINTLKSHNMLDFFLPLDLEYASAASSVLIIVDDILRYNGVPKLTKNLANQILDEIAASGNAVAKLRRTELDDLRQLAAKLWQDFDHNRGDPQQSLEGNDTTASGRSQAIADEYEPPEATSGILTTNPAETSSQDVSPASMRTNLLPDTRRDTVPRDLNCSQAQTRPTEALRLDSEVGNNTIRRFSTSSSQDLALNFDLAGDEMLLLADQIDVDALEETLDFDLNGDYHWILNDDPD